MLNIKNLEICYDQNKILNDLNLTIVAQQSTAIIGANGCGKSSLLYAIMGLITSYGGRCRGVIGYNYNNVEINMVNCSRAQQQKICGKKIGLIFQDAGHYFNPLRKLSHAFDEALSKKAATQVKEMMPLLGLMDMSVLDCLPTQLSVGQLQRLMVLLTVLRDPELILADEPTANLDDENAQRVMAMLRKWSEQSNKALLIVTHDMDVARQTDKVYEIVDGVLQHRKILTANKTKILAKKNNDSQQGKQALLELNNVIAQYCQHKISLNVYKEQKILIRGKSGIGKSSLAKAILGLREYSGEIKLYGDKASNDIMRKNIHLVMQDMEFNPVLTIKQLLQEACVIGGKPWNMVGAVLNIVCLGKNCELNALACKQSLGQQQKLNIAIGLLVDKPITIFDESLSAVAANDKTKIISYLCNHRYRAHIFFQHQDHILFENMDVIMDWK